MASQVSTRRYLFSEDSALLGTARSEMENGGVGRLLEIGAGGGRNLRDFCKSFDLAVGTDILPMSEMRSQRTEGVEIIIADRGTCFRSGTFDMVVFNPPYLPSDSAFDRAVDGGRGGVEVPLSFLDEALRVSTPTSKIVAILSSHSDLEEFEARCRKSRLQFNIIAERKLFFETLYAYLIERKPC